MLYSDTSLVKRQAEAAKAAGHEPPPANLQATSTFLTASQPMDFAASWAFILEPLDGQRTRLVERFRVRFGADDRPWTKATLPVVGFGVFLMVRRQLLGLRDRVEGMEPAPQVPTDGLVVSRPSVTGRAMARRSRRPTGTARMRTIRPTNRCPSRPPSDGVRAMSGGIDRLESGSVRSVMSADPIVVWPDTPLGEVDELLERYGIGGLPVVDPMDFPMGVVSRIDVLRMSERGPNDDGWRSLDTRLAMTAPPIVIDAEATVRDAAELLVERRVHRLVVVDPRSGAVVGVVTATDLLAGLAAADVPSAGAVRPGR